MITKGTTCVALCCRREYPAKYDFEPKTPYLRTAKKVYLRGKCFPCKLRTEIAPELKKHGIVVT